MEPASQHSQDTANPVVPQWELLVVLNWDNFALKGHLARSADICGRWGYWHLVGRGQGCCWSLSCNVQDSCSKEVSSYLNISNAEFEKPWLVLPSFVIRNKSLSLLMMVTMMTAHTYEALMPTRCQMLHVHYFGLTFPTVQWCSFCYHHTFNI